MIFLSTVLKHLYLDSIIESDLENIIKYVLSNGFDEILNDTSSQPYRAYSVEEFKNDWSNILNEMI
jgi:hypothetical protein